MNVRHKISTMSLVKLAVAGCTGVFAIAAFWTEFDISALLRQFQHNLLVATVSLLVAIAINVIFLPVAYVGIGVFVLRRTMSGAYERWDKKDAPRRGKLQRITLRLSGKDIKLRMDQAVLESLEASPPSPGAPMRVTLGPLGMVLRIMW